MIFINKQGRSEEFTNQNSLAINISMSAQIADCIKIFAAFETFNCATCKPCHPVYTCGSFCNYLFKTESNSGWKKCKRKHTRLEDYWSSETTFHTFKECKGWMPNYDHHQLWLFPSSASKNRSKKYVMRLRPLDYEKRSSTTFSRCTYRQQLLEPQPRNNIHPS